MKKSTRTGKKLLAIGAISVVYFSVCSASVMVRIGCSKLAR